MRQSRAPGARRSPPPSPPRFPPAAGPGGAGRSTCRRWLPGRPAGSASAAAARRERCPPASRLPPGDARAPGGHLRGSAARALPAGSTELPDLRVRPQRRPENGRRRLGPDARSTPGAGRRAARPRTGPRGAAGCEARGPGATAAEPPCRPWPPGAAQAPRTHPSPLQFDAAPNSQGQGVTCAFPWLSGEA